jgi:hypothetical protein
MPKTPSELKEQAEKRNAERPADDHSLTAEGLKVPNPARGDFFSNLEKVSEPDTEDAASS